MKFTGHKIGIFLVAMQFILSPVSGGNPGDIAYRFFSNMSHSASMESPDSLSMAWLQRLVNDARTLHENAVEGMGEGQFQPGSKAVLEAYILDAEEMLDYPGLTTEMADLTTWSLADACVTFETGVTAIDFDQVDPLATKETRYLYNSLYKLSGNHMMFGMHDATGYGVGWTDDDDRSDVKDVCGSYPAVYSEDLNKVERGVDIDRMQYRVTSAYNRGGVITFSWHQYDPEWRSFYSEDLNNENIVATILPGGEYHDFYKQKLARIAWFLKTLRGSGGESVPVIFRPYHEHTGGWFWWGAGQCTTGQYNELWQYTFDFLKDSLNVHNLLYAISPTSDHINSADDYYTIYPGDDVIDIFGLDNYFSANILRSEKEEYTEDIRRIVRNALDRGKIAALTEVGQENITTTDLYTKYMLDPVKTDEITRQIPYLATWRNSHTGHHFAPYPGHPGVPDFVDFYNDPFTLFEDQLPDMYVLWPDNEPPVLSGYPLEEFIAFDTPVTLDLLSDERAFLRYAFTDESFGSMPYEFTSGQGMMHHSTQVPCEQGQTYHLYIRAADHLGNETDASVELVFNVDTMLTSVAWKNRDYDAEGWKQSAAPFSFDTTSTSGTAVDPGQTIYFRKQFSITDPGSLFQLVCFVQYDNGFVMYLNGDEVGRGNMPEGPVTYDTWAGSSTSLFSTVSMDSSVLRRLLREDNLLALEIHQRQNDSTDMQFDLKMIRPETVIDYDEEWLYSDEGQYPPDQIVSTVGMIHKNLPVPRIMDLYQNYPNPFNSRTVISYRLKVTGFIDLSIHDILGQKVTTLVSSKQPAGEYTVQWDASNYPSGIYYVQLKAERRESNVVRRTRKLVLIK